MTDLAKLSRRERQIMEIVFSRKKASVQEICGELPDPPTPMAVRRMLAILQEKGCVKREKRGREFVYLPRQSKERAGVKALRQVLATFFDGSVGTALAAHLERSDAQLSEEDIERLRGMIEEHARERG